jgi:hypothetical protein
MGRCDLSTDKLYIGGEKFGPIRIGANPETFWMYVKRHWLRRGTVRAEMCAVSEKIGFNPFIAMHWKDRFVAGLAVEP